MSGKWLGVDPRMDIKKLCVERDWTIFSRFTNHYSSAIINITGGPI